MVGDDRADRRLLVACRQHHTDPAVLSWPRSSRHAGQCAPLLVRYVAHASTTGGAGRRPRTGTPSLVLATATGCSRSRTTR